MSETKLLPCPFCGGEARVITTTQLRHPWAHGGMDALGYAVTCADECGATIPSSMTERDAVERWNMRAEREW